MNTTTRALAFVLLTAAVAPAADPVPGKPLDTTFLKQYAETRGYMLGRPQKPKIAPDGKTVLFLRADPKSPKMKLFEFEVATGKTKELLSPEMLLKGAEENLSPEEKARRERQRVSVGGFTDFHFDKEGKNVLVALSGKLYVFERATAKATELRTGDGSIIDPKWSPDGTKIAYVRGYDRYAATQGKPDVPFSGDLIRDGRGFDVFVYDLAAGKESAVTKGGTATKTHGLAEFVAQEEMGRHSGYWWSPDGKHIAYEEAEHTGVETWYVADPLKPDAKPAEQFYPRPGKKNVAVRLGVVAVTGGETVWVEWDRKKYEYLARVAWGRGTLLLVLQSRDQREIGIAYGNPTTGELSIAYHNRTKDGWISVPSEPVAKGPGIGSKQFLMVGDHHTGKPHLLGHTAKDGVVDYGPANELLGIPENEEKAFVTRQRFDDDPTTQIVMSFPFSDSTQGFIWLDHNRGIHSAVISSVWPERVTTSTTLDGMPRLRFFGNNTDPVDLPSVAVEPPFQPNVKVEKIGDYWTAVVRPRDFDPKKKYPVIVDVYGGPKHLHVVQAMRNWLVPQWLADQGFIVVAIDNRGTPGRGREWERSVYQKFGTVPIEDQAKGVLALCDKFPELDRDRVGIVGWSFGGYNAANGVLRKPEVFKAAVAGAPVTDWEDYDTHYTERYMGLLPESKAAYEDASLILLAKNLKRPLMLVHGTADDNVYYRHSLKLADALFRAGKDFDAVALPGVTHMYSADPTVMERLWAKTATFFKTHLGEPK